MTRVLNWLAHPPYQSTRCNHHCLLPECSRKTMGWRVCKTIYHFFPTYQFTALSFCPHLPLFLSDTKFCLAFTPIAALQLWLHVLQAHFVMEVSHPAVTKFQNYSFKIKLDFLLFFFFFLFQKPWLPSIRYAKSLLQSMYLRSSIITNNLSSHFWIELFLYFWIFFKYQIQTSILKFYCVQQVFSKRRKKLHCCWLKYYLDIYLKQFH